MAARRRSGIASCSAHTCSVQAAEERAEAQQARAAERALAERVEARRSDDLEMSQCEARGEYVNPAELAMGHVTATPSLMS